MECERLFVGRSERCVKESGVVFFFCKEGTAEEFCACLVGVEMCIRGRIFIMEVVFGISITYERPWALNTT